MLTAKNFYLVIIESMGEHYTLEVLFTLVVKILEDNCEDVINKYS